MKLYKILHYLFGSIWEVFLDLVVREFEDLKAITECGLSSLSFSEVVDNLLIWIGLLYIIIVEIYDGVPIREHFSLHSVIEYNLLLSVFIHSLYLSIISDDLFHHLHVRWALVMILRRELHVIVFLFFLVVIRFRCVQSLSLLLLLWLLLL
jgi:hypothetical protein